LKLDPATGKGLDKLACEVMAQPVEVVE